MIDKLRIPVSWMAGGMLTSKEIDQTASTLLSIIEKAGMLPPYKTKERQYPDCQLIHTWEKEQDDE